MNIYTYGALQVDAFRAELLPQDKLAVMRELVEGYGCMKTCSGVDT